ncbi:hypothetical protein TNCV_2993161 [Trichonephila clavipes]|nr:hypothetical protein TNCV_2993161 [Trichonephila clavipes]
MGAFSPRCITVNRHQDWNEVTLSPNMSLELSSMSLDPRVKTIFVSFISFDLSNMSLDLSSMSFYLSNMSFYLSNTSWDLSNMSWDLSNMSWDLSSISFDPCLNRRSGVA